MKRIFTKISGLSLIAATLFSAGCLGDEILGSESSGTSESSSSTIPDNSVIDSRVFEVLNLDYSGLEGVKALYEADQYYLAAQALLEYYRNRTDVVNTNVNLIAPSITDEEQVRADKALSENEYHFYVEGYNEGEIPNSYLSGSKIDWTLNPSGDSEELYRLHRLAWMVPQGKAYRTSLDETYVSDWMTVYTSWLESFPLPADDGTTDYDAAVQSNAKLYAWRPQDVACRIEDQCDLLYYFMQSSSFTPEVLSSFLANLAEQAEHVMAHYSEDSDLQTDEAHAVFRAGTIFPEMKQAATWVESGSGLMNGGIDGRIFEVLDLSYSGLTKVQRSYLSGDYYMALEELLNYYRSRTHGLNPSIDVTSDTPTDNERSWAEYALFENGYRFYVNNFFDTSVGPNVPYSYMNSTGDGIDWTYWPSGDQEQRYQLHRHQWMLPQAKTYNTTRDERYARNWMEVYGDWLEQNPKPEQGTDVTNSWTWRPLDVASRVIDQCGILEYYQTSESITAEWIAEVLYHFDEQTNHIINNYTSSTTNHLITEAQAVTFAGMLFPEMKNSSIWKSSGATTLAGLVTDGYYSDGWLKDGDLSYHIASIEDFRLSLLVAQLNNGESYFPSSYVPAMQSMTDVVMNMVYPDYSVPNMADTRASSWTKSVLTRNLTNYSVLFPDNAELEWMATAGASGTMPETRGKVFPDAGYYVMRSGWTTSDMMMVLQNTPVGPGEQWHRQYDNNTFELWVKGRNFFPDSGCYSYGGDVSSNAQRAKYAATTAHNTISLNNANVSAGGKLLKEISNESGGHWYDALVLENPSYSGLTHRRTVFLVDGLFYVLLDEAYGTAEGTVNLNFNITEGSTSEVVLDADDNGFHTAFSDGNNLLVRTFCEKPVSFVERDGFVSYAINSTSDRQAYQLNVSKESSDNVVRFVTVLLPASSPAGESVSAEFSGDWSTSGNTVKVTCQGTTYTLSYTL